ncbi:MAG: tol-pal system protein YbgF [Deltaproteobacteria bacterium]|nr:tol-pal system protein YbgF [Deltaproteobacteria bacterium]
MRIQQSGIAFVRFFFFFGLALAIPGCAIPPSSLNNNGAGSLQEKVQELSEQVEKNQDNLLLLEARMRDHQQIIDSLIAKKVTETAPKGFARVLGREEAGGEVTPTSVYLEAFGEFAAGRYESAIVKFETFLEKFPDNHYVGNARFWLGECYFSLEQFDKAVEEYNQVVNLYPHNEKVPEALMKTVQAYRRLYQEEKAEKALRFLLNNYPDSPAARTLSEESLNPDYQ